MLAADSVVRHYGRGTQAVTVLDGISVTVAPGQRVALCGPSGSGKSTMARVLALLERPDAGTVILDGAPVREAGLALPRELRLRVALLWQSPRLAADPRLNLASMVGEPLRSGGRRHRPAATELDARVSEACARVGLVPELRERFPHEVSEGQLQRACLARALITAPSYLICDEPTSMLDVSTQAALLAAIADDVRARGAGVLLITHDRLLAEHWCDWIIDLPALRAPGGTR
ncbi:MAG: ABC transporter ATP-binding protein [Pseudonocardiaceae bacterium]